MIKSLTAHILAMASHARLTSIEQAYAGSPFASNNRVARYQGLSSKGHPVIKADGKTLSVSSTSLHTPRPSQKVVLRAGKGILRIQY